MPQKGKIFISYRRIDTSYAAGRIYDRLAARFGEEAIFMDVEVIEGGLDFVKVLEDAVQSCDVLIALIGRQWLSSKDDGGNLRLDNPDDFVRIEIATALKRNIRVIPVLVDGIDMPRSTELPENLKLLARRNALQVNHHSFNPDVFRLITHIESALKAAEESRIIKAQAFKAVREKREHEATEKVKRETENQKGMQGEQRLNWKNAAKFFPKRGYLLIGIVGLMLSIIFGLLSFNGQFGATPIPTPTESPGPKDFTPCKNSDDPNIYQPISSSSLSSFIYENALLEDNILLFDSNKLPDAKLGAYLRLAGSVKNWSDTTDFPVFIENTDNHFVRLTITFISPEIIEWVLLNQYLEAMPLPKEAFVEHVNSTIDEFEKLNEFIFLLTFTSSYKNPSITDLDILLVNAIIDKIMLFETNGKLIKKSYSDPPLGQDRYVSREFLSGYIAYPMFVHRYNKCTATLDNITNMTMQVGKVSINGNEYPPAILTLNYHSLLSFWNRYLPAPIPIPDNKLIREPGMETAPPNPTSGADTENALYWQNMASYIWWYLAGE